MLTPTKRLYINNTCQDISGFHGIIVAAIAAGGKFDEDFADIFTLTRCPEGSGSLWRLDMA